MDVDKHQAESANDDEDSFKRFIQWRWAPNGTSIEIQVEWAAGDTTWEYEVNLHEDPPEALLGYWREHGGRPVSPKDPDMFDVLAVRDHSADRKRLLVEWAGFGPKDATWVSRRSVEQTAPSVVAQYMKGVRKEKTPVKQPNAVAKARMASSTASPLAKHAAKAKEPAQTKAAAAAKVSSANGAKDEGSVSKKRGRPAMRPPKRRPGIAYRVHGQTV